MGLWDILHDGFIALHDASMKNNPEYYMKNKENPDWVDRVERLREKRANEKWEQYKKQNR